MDNVLQDMVQRLRAIELLLRTQNELLTRMLADLQQITDSTAASNRSESKDRERIRKRAAPIGSVAVDTTSHREL
jgi:hypothetical protein